MKLTVAVLAVLATTLAAAPVLTLAAGTDGSGGSTPKAKHSHHGSSHHGSSHHGKKSGGTGSTSGASGGK
jgi:hypothetical protein